MQVRYIQAAVSSEDHILFSVFACEKQMTLSELVGIAVKEYITQKRKEEAGRNEVANSNTPGATEG